MATVRVDAKLVTSAIRREIDSKAMAVTKDDTAYEEILWALSRHMVDPLPKQTGALALGRAVQGAIWDAGTFRAKNGKTYKRTAYPRTGQISYHARSLSYAPCEERPSGPHYYADKLNAKTGAIEDAKREAESSQAFLEEAAEILARHMEKY